MKKFILIILGCMVMMISQISNAQNDIIQKQLDTKMDQAFAYLKTDPSKSWAIMVEVSAIIKSHPEYDDGEYAEDMSGLVVDLLLKPWKFAAPYITGNKGDASFHDFIFKHINELATPTDLKAIRKNVSKNCDQTKYPICKKLIITIEKSYE